MEKQDELVKKKDNSLLNKAGEWFKGLIQRDRPQRCLICGINKRVSKGNCQDGHACQYEPNTLKG